MKIRTNGMSFRAPCLGVAPGIVISNRKRMQMLCLTMAVVLVGARVAASEAFPLQGQTERGLIINLAPQSGTVRIGQASTWTLSVEGPVSDEIVSIRFEAGMPAHGHGLPIPAQVDRAENADVYTIKNVLFNMGGRWLIEVWVGYPDGIESVTFELTLAEDTELQQGSTGFSQAEVAVLRSLALTTGPRLQDPTNRLSGNREAQQLGEQIFFDRLMSGTNKTACSSCHQPALAYTDGRAVSIGSKPLNRNAPSLLGLAGGRWFYWDGRRDSLWAQAITPLESPGEMDNARTDIVRYVTIQYNPSFSDTTGIHTDFSDTISYPPGAGPFAGSAGRARWLAMSRADRDRINEAFSAVGKVLAAYIETLDHPPTRFDQFISALSEQDQSRAKSLITDSEQSGAKLFVDVDRTHCLRCHNGPSLTNFGFHSIGSQGNFLDLGRQFGLDAARLDPFSCTGAYSDARENCELTSLRGIAASEFAGAFKVPSLRNLTVTGPYFHDGRFDTLEQVIDFYVDPPDAEAGNHEAPPLDLDREEQRDLVSFLKMLSADNEAYLSKTR